MIVLNLKDAVTVNSGADGNAVAALESQLGHSLPDGYRDVLAIANGFSMENGLLIYSSDDVFERNVTFEVPGYAPGFLAIGDDSGGRSILIPFEGEGIYIVDQGSMDPDDFDQLDISLDKWVANGCPMSSPFSLNVSCATRGRLVGRGMTEHQYPISREDIREREHLEALLTAFAAANDENMRAFIANIGEALYRDAVRLGLDEDVAVLCEFARRVGSELLSDDLRSEFFDNNVWGVRPRDEVFLLYKNEGRNADRSVLLRPDVRNVATALHFFVTLNWDPRFKETAQRVKQYITDNALWSYVETRRAYESRL